MPFSPYANFEVKPWVYFVCVCVCVDVCVGGCGPLGDCECSRWVSEGVSGGVGDWVHMHVWVCVYTYSMCL